MKWFEALTLWNSKKGSSKWCIPRRGTPEYHAIMKIMKEAKEKDYEKFDELDEAMASKKKTSPKKVPLAKGKDKEDIVSYYEHNYVTPILDAVEDFEHFEASPKELKENVYKALGALAYADETVGEKFNPIRKLIDRIWDKYPDETQKLADKYKAWRKRHGVKPAGYKGFGREADSDSE